MKCDFCGGQSGFEVYTKNGKSFCSMDCEIRFFTTPNHRKQQKHEKIERMAWELHKDFLLALSQSVDIDMENDQDAREKAWSFAEQFYKFAKMKEQEGASDE